MNLTTKRMRALGLFILSCALAGCATGAPPQIPAAKIARSPSVDAPVVVSVGDSIMKGNGLTTAQAWPVLMAESNGWTSANLACNGEGFVAPGDPADCNGPFGVLAPRVALLHPTTLVISGSSNDFGIDNATLAAATGVALKSYREALPKVQIVALSTVWGDTEPPAQLADVDEQVREATADVGGTFINIGQPLAGHPEWLQPDDVHPTAEGQQKLAAAISAALSAQHVNLAGP